MSRDCDEGNNLVSLGNNQNRPRRTARVGMLLENSFNSVVGIPLSSVELGCFHYGKVASLQCASGNE